VKALRALLDEQVVRSRLVNERGKEVAMFWYLEAIEMPERPRGPFSEAFQTPNSPECSLILAYLSCLGNV
jgi:hypothetical protein